MSEHGPYQPPGDQPPGSPPPGSPPPGSPPPWTRGAPPPGGGPPAGMLGAAHKPGAMPLRPLGLSDMFDAAFRILRFNPKATVGAALLVAALTQAIPVAVATASTGFSGGASLGGAGGIGGSGGTVSSSEVVGFVASFGSLAASTLLLQVGLILLTGVVAHVTHAAAVGRKLDLAEAWACTRGKRWRLLGLVLLVALFYLLGLGLWAGSIVAVVLTGASGLLVVLYAVLSGLFLVVPLGIFFNVRVSHFAAVALMLEDVGVLGAFRRAYRLSSAQFWRIFGIGLLTGLVTGAAAFVLGLPFGLAGQIAAVAVPQLAVLLLVVAQAVSTIVSTAFTAPFTSAVTTLQYLDQRMRKEAYDVELMAQAGITGA